MTPVLTPPLVGAAAPFASFPENTVRHGDPPPRSARVEQHEHDRGAEPAPATPDGLQHVGSVVLDARQYKTAAFGHEVLRLIGELRVPGWTHVTAPYAHAHAKSLPGHTAALSTHTQPAQTQSLPAHAAHTASTTLPGETGPLPAAAGLQIEKVSGSLTNAVFFISWRGGGRTVPTVLLRIYGPSSSTLISRRRELSTLHVLSTVYGIGPRIYGTFVNGRVEEYFESAALTSASVREGEVSRWVGRRMAELHCVDLGVVWGAGDNGVESVRRNVGSWLGPAREVLGLARGRDGRADGLDLARFEEEWGRYWGWLEEWEGAHGRSERVFAHNDTQYGNLLRLTGRAEAAHETIIVVDFEYAGPNALAYDIANHFHEWMADYHGARPHELRAGRYPTAGERRNFYRAYMGERARRGQGVFEGTGAGGAGYPSEAELSALDGAVCAWSAASHGMWAVWGIVQAREQVGGVDAGEGEFDYLGYAASRMALFRRAVASI